MATAELKGVGEACRNHRSSSSSGAGLLFLSLSLGLARSSRTLQTKRVLFVSRGSRPRTSSPFGRAGRWVVYIFAMPIKWLVRFANPPGHDPIRSELDHFLKLENKFKILVWKQRNFNINFELELENLQRYSFHHEEDDECSVDSVRLVRLV